MLQRNHRIQIRRPPGRNVACSKAHGNQQNSHRRESSRIGRAGQIEAWLIAGERRSQSIASRLTNVIYLVVWAEQAYFILHSHMSGATMV